ncbi:hypothetical protein [Wolbachia endosymbiont (group A) of Myopa testacea]|uniref:hypothetical protein n=1 Tax=Wolbachia endosymbiont (group A) of Myopa testacea TaxID=3066148 RepID=UPI0031329E57
MNTNEEKFTLDILNYLDKQNAGRFTLVDKHGSTIVPLIDLDGKGGKAVKVDSFALSADITLNKEKIEGIMEKTLEEIWEEKRTILKEEQKLYNDTAKSEHSQIVLGENAVKELD